MNDPLFCLVCGYERGGTTLVSELIRQDPGIDGRFEIGFLLADPLSKFPEMHPFARNVKIAWGLDGDALQEVCAAPSYSEAYSRLLERSNLPDKTVRIYDKTPRYMRYLPQIMEKVDVPVVCVVRDPRGVYWSTQKRWDTPPMRLGRLRKPYRWLTAPSRPAALRSLTQRLYTRYQYQIYQKAFCSDYITYGRAYQKAVKQYADRILLVQYERLCAHPEAETRRIYNFLGLEFDPVYLTFPEEPDPYVNRGGIRPEFALEYQGLLPPADQRRLLRWTAEFSAWHWNE